MKSFSKQQSSMLGRVVSAAAFTACLAVAPLTVQAVDRDANEDRTEIRIKQLQTKLKITGEQQEKWSKVELAMREDAKTMDALTQSRMDHAAEMTAIDDLKSYGEIAEAHSNGLKKLIPLFEDLYASFSDTQKKEADILFREGSEHKRKAHKNGHVKAASK